MEVTLDIPDDLVEQLGDLENQLPEILIMGVEKLLARAQSKFDDLSDIVELLVAFPAPEEILKLRPTEKLQARMNELLEKNRSSGLLPDEQKECDQYAYLEHIVRIAKANAAQKLKTQTT